MPILQSHRLKGHRLQGFWCSLGDPETARKVGFPSLVTRAAGIPSTGSFRDREGLLILPDSRR